VHRVDERPGQRRCYSDLALQADLGVFLEALWRSVWGYLDDLDLHCESEIDGHIIWLIWKGKESLADTLTST
jgi:hypothetical protein